MGFMESNHAEYLDNDRNLLHLDYLVLAETWLTSSVSNSTVISKLKNWRLIKRLDATDDVRHMDLILICPMKSAQDDLLYSLDYIEGYKSGNKERVLLYQGLVMNLRKYYQTVVYLYIKETPNEKETTEIRQRCDKFDVIMGDLNLNPSKETEKNKIMKLCNSTKYMALEEVTTVNNNQLDHILISLSLKSFCLLHPTSTLAVITNPTACASHLVKMNLVRHSYRISTLILISIYEKERINQNTLKTQYINQNLT